MTSKRGCLSRHSELKFKVSAGLDGGRSTCKIWTERFPTGVGARDQEDGRVEVNDVRRVRSDWRWEMGDQRLQGGRCAMLHGGG